MPLSRSEQARVNGAKSRGPKTREGKARSSANALKHGRYANNAIVLSNEDTEAFEELVANYVRRIQPADPVEYELTRELAGIDWRLTRIYALDTRLLDHEMDIQSPAFDSAGVAVAELTRVTTAGRSIVDRSQYPNYLARRESQLVRARQSILTVLKDLRKNFPLAESADEIIYPQPLNPELPTPIEPETNPTGSPKRVSAGSEDAPLLCAEPPGSAPLDKSNRVSADPEGSALLRPEEPPASAPLDNPNRASTGPEDTPLPNPEEPANSTPSDKSRGLSSTNSPSESVASECTVSEEALSRPAASPSYAQKETHQQGTNLPNLIPNSDSKGAAPPSAAGDAALDSPNLPQAA